MFMLKVESKEGDLRAARVRVVLRSRTRMVHSSQDRKVSRCKHCVKLFSIENWIEYSILFSFVVHSPHFGDPDLVSQELGV